MDRLLMANNITNIQATSNKAAGHTVRPSFSGSWLVTSAASGNVYRTRLAPIASCTCDWSKYQPAGSPVACSHVQATLAYVEEQDGYKAKFFAEGEDLSNHHRRVVKLGNGVQATARKVAKPAPQPSGDEIDDWFSYG